MTFKSANLQSVCNTHNTKYKSEFWKLFCDFNRNTRKQKIPKNSVYSYKLYDAVHCNIIKIYIIIIRKCQYKISDYHEIAKSVELNTVPKNSLCNLHLSVSIFVVFFCCRNRSNNFL